MTVTDIRDITSFKWATVTATGPLQIQIDGDPAPLALLPDSLVDPASLGIGDRVRVEMSLRKVVIHGVSNGTPTVSPYWPGKMEPTPLAAAPAGWLLCQGQSLSRAAYPELFAAISTQFGAVNGSSFSLPDLRGKTIFGMDATADFNVRGKVGGTKVHSHTLTKAVVALWAGFFKNRGGVSWAATNTNNYAIPGGSALTQTAGPAVEGVTDDSATLPPYIALNYIIKT